MSGKMEMSLDDIIKQNKGNRHNVSRRRGGNSSRRGRTSGSSPRRGSIRGGRKPTSGVLRGRNRGSISRRNSNFVRSLANYKREAFLGSNNNSSLPRRYGSGSDTTKLIVSNLDFGVTDSDILELFSEFGPLKSAGVHYDRSGRSLGSADLIFERRADAIKAMKQYNGVPLDGREMNIQLATSEIPGVKPMQKISRLSDNGITIKPRTILNRTRPSGRIVNRSRGPSKRGVKSKAARGAKKEPPPTAEELDAQLEEYVKSKVSNSEGA